MSATAPPAVRRRPCPRCGVEVLAIDPDGGTVWVEVAEVDLAPMGGGVLLDEHDAARRCRPFTPRRKGEALHRVHVCALADVA